MPVAPRGGGKGGQIHHCSFRLHATLTMETSAPFTPVDLPTQRASRHSVCGLGQPDPNGHAWGP